MTARLFAAVRRWLCIAVFGNDGWAGFVAEHEARTSASDLSCEEVRP